ncbi:MAG: ribosomal RNA small subunit methyltransferase A [Bacilli bacterium]|nr:ribosomal RNA small subunit methyltransferase A [Bacilli bacterium]
MNYSEVMNLLNKYKLSPDKNFGQNFLIDNNIISQIASCAKGKNVIEIGPGLGSLTNELVKVSKKVLCYEIDLGMANVIENELCNKYSNIKLIRGDFLKQDLENDIKKYFDDDDIYVVANLPYYITTAILIKILEETKRVKLMRVMMQKEVGSRLMGAPNTKDYNSLSVLLQYYTKVEKSINVPRNCFHPSPNVDSVVLDITRKDELLFVESEKYFLSFNRALFSMRRKTIVNNLNNYFKYDKTQISGLLERNRYKATTRAEELTVEQIVDLSNEFYKEFQ